MRFAHRKIFAKIDDINLQRLYEYASLDSLSKYKINQSVLHCFLFLVTQSLTFLHLI